MQHANTPTALLLQTRVLLLASARVPKEFLDLLKDYLTGKLLSKIFPRPAVYKLPGEVSLDSACLTLECLVCPYQGGEKKMSRSRRVSASRTSGRGRISQINRRTTRCGLAKWGHMVPGVPTHTWCLVLLHMVTGFSRPLPDSSTIDVEI